MENQGTSNNSLPINENSNTPSEKNDINIPSYKHYCGLTNQGNLITSPRYNLLSQLSASKLVYDA